MGVIKVLSGGLLTTLQDAGRTGYQKYGMPVAGAMDQKSLYLANTLAGNKRSEVCMEITLIGPTLEFCCDRVFSLTGANLSPKLNNKSIPMNMSLHAKKGDILSFGTIKYGARTYLAVAGGFEAQYYMESGATYEKAGIGGFKGRKLKDCDELPLRELKSHTTTPRSAPAELITKISGNITVRVIEGPEVDAFELTELEKFYANEYILTNQSDRMGLRLEGPEISFRNKPDILSSGVALGTIQIAGSKKPMIMMSDRQTTGGYLRIANVISVDIPSLAQLKPGDRIHFQKTGVEHAQNLLREYEKAFADWMSSLNEQESGKGARYFYIKVNGEEFNVSVTEIQPDMAK